MNVIEVQGRDAVVAEWLSRARHGRVLLTRRGAPAAVVTSVEGLDIEQVMTASDPEFWRMIAERREEDTVSLSEARESLEV
jgi:prevent-host-death family protein